MAANGVLQGYRVVYEPLAPVQGEPGGPGRAASRGTALHRPRGPRLVAGGWAGAWVLFPAQRLGAWDAYAP